MWSFKTIIVFAVLVINLTPSQLDLWKVITTIIIIIILKEFY